ncbi:hypothetical protein GIB67_004557 [Kingdonia uniflora]|uniref:Folate receptor-like domain-containing protein n=1 Tax=Kingdonia uniflora TaxID=39325 RepID=A0A7J7ML00_9MAGN|nr:hypothetical protein GIB67_004557 [Kingdonia uniflora]
MGCYGFHLLLLFFTHLIFSSTGKPNGVCISQGGRFPPFSSEGKPPQKVSKGPKDLNLCRVFRRRTCCDISQTYPAFLSIRRLVSTGEADQECLQLWELLECSICDPCVGVQPGPPILCSSFCNRVFQACSSAYFSIDLKTQVLLPCGLSDFVCGRASEWASNGTELCKIAGFAVKPSEDSHQGEEGPSCYGGKASLGSISDSWRSSQSGVPRSAENLRFFDDIQQWVRERPFSERVSWAVGGMVLTAGLLFVSLCTIGDDQLVGFRSFIFLELRSHPRCNKFQEQDVSWKTRDEETYTHSRCSVLEHSSRKGSITARNDELNNPFASLEVENETHDVDEIGVGAKGKGPATTTTDQPRDPRTETPLGHVSQPLTVTKNASAEVSTEISPVALAI